MTDCTICLRYADNASADTPRGANMEQSVCAREGTEPQTVRATVVNGKPRREGNGTRGNAKKGWHSARRDIPQKTQTSAELCRCRSNSVSVAPFTHRCPTGFLSDQHLSIARVVSPRAYTLDIPEERYFRDGLPT